MSGTDTRATYALNSSTEEYERLRLQARIWQGATESVLDRVGVPAGASCLDAGCGPGETMRSLADRVGPGGRVVGLDVDADLAARTRAGLRADGYDQCRVRRHDLTIPEPLPGERYDVVYTRLVLFHLPQRRTVLERLWDAVAPGGVLIAQDFALGSIRAIPHEATVVDAHALLVAGFESAGCDVETGLRLPALFAEAGLGEPDGTDIACRVEPLPTGALMLERTCRSVLPGAVARGRTTAQDAERTLTALADTAATRPSSHLLWPLLGAAWKRRPRW